MKNLISFITFLIFLHGITNHMTSTEAKEVSHDPVLDVEGNELVEGDNYALVMPQILPWGGVYYYSIPDENCTYGVRQIILEEGIPVTFKLVKSELEGTIIRESTDLNIKFCTSLGCAPSTVWKVSQSTQLVTTGGVAGDTGIGNSNSWFQILKAGDDYYKFFYCPPAPRTCLDCFVLCDDVGISHQHDVRSLALNGTTTFHFRFRKVQLKHEHEMY